MFVTLSMQAADETAMRHLVEDDCPELEVDAVEITCPDCNGAQGHFGEPYRLEVGTWRDCETCDGTGWVRP